MPDPAWPSSPPEANYLRLAGPGAAGTSTTLANGAAWQALMAGNEVAFSLSAVNTAVTALNFEGVGGLSSVSAITGLNTALQLLAGWVQEKPPIAASAVAAYETALSSMIPAEVSIANRTEQAADVAINPAVLGALTPAIVALDTEYYGEHWPHNAGAGATYGAALAVLVAALAVPPPMAPLGASPAAPATAAAAVAQTAGTTAAGEAMKQSGEAAQTAGRAASAPVDAMSQAGQLGSTAAQPLQSAMGAVQPLMGMFSTPMQAFQGLSSMPQSMLGSLGGMTGGPRGADVAVPAEPVRSGAAVAGAGGGAAGGGAPGGGGGGVPGAGLTSYTRPTSSFAAEGAGRPAGLKPGLLTASEWRGPTAPAAGGTPMPVSPAQAGMLGHGRGDNGKDTVAHARVVVAGDAGFEGRSSS